MDNKVILCNNCQGKLSVPANRGVLEITCPKCKYVFRYNSGAKPSSNSNTVTKPTGTVTNAATKPTGTATNAGTKSTYEGATRQICFVYGTERIGHSMDKLENAFAKNFQIKLYVDKQQVAAMVNKQSVDVTVSAGEHRLFASLTNVPLLGEQGFFVPAGTENYLVFVNKAGAKYELCGGPIPDPFLEGLMVFVDGMFQKQGISDRILMPSNRRHDLELNFDKDCMKISWQLVNPKGLQQWSTGGDSEKIYYYEMGLTPPRGVDREYWTYVCYMIADVINKTKDYTCTPNGIVKLRTIHNLY